VPNGEYDMPPVVATLLASARLAQVVHKEEKRTNEK
jgi:hypothetical protein